MTSWTSGYVAEIDYTYGYYPELNPARIRLALALQGVAAPEIKTACELGFGQGVSLNIHAGASVVSWWGTDFNPSQAAFAKELAAHSGANLFDQSFEEFCSRSDLPDFDFIALHGIWTWVSDKNRQIIVDFVRRKLKVGGVLYISYNTLPGWSTASPLRHLFTEHKDVLSAPGSGILKQVQEALGFTDEVLSAKPLWAQANPSIGERFGKLKTQNPNYLAHEFFNRDWQPIYYSDMARRLSEAKLTFASSANYIDQIDVANLTVEQQRILCEFTEPNFRQTLRDFMVNQQFRKDYWVKGQRKLNDYDKAMTIRSQEVVLLTAGKEVPFKAVGTLGEINLNEDVAKPILDLLSDYNAHSIAEIEKHCETLKLTQILQTIVFLIAQGHLAPAQSASEIDQGKKTAHALNRSIIERAKGGSEINFLANPVTGGAIGANRFQQLFLLSHLAGAKSPNAMALYAWDILNKQGQKLVNEGKTLESAEENISLLKEQAEAFEKKALQLIIAHHIV